MKILLSATICLGLPNLACNSSFILWVSVKFLQIIALGPNLTPLRGHKFYRGLYRENFRNLLVPSHEALGYQILHVEFSGGPVPRVPKLEPCGELWPCHGGHKFHMGLYIGKTLKISLSAPILE